MVPVAACVLSRQALPFFCTVCWMLAHVFALGCAQGSGRGMLPWPRPCLGLSLWVCIGRVVFFVTLTVGTCVVRGHPSHVLTVS